MNPATPTHRTAPTTVEAPAPTSTTPGNVIPFSPVPSLDSINGTNSYTPRPYASPRMLREEKRHLVDKLARYARTTKNPTARRYHSKIKGCGITPIGQGVTLVRHTSKGTITGGGVRNVARCKDRGCPVCAALTEGTRAKLLRAALLILHHTGALEGHRMIFATLTMGHRFNDDHARNWQVFRSVLADLKNQRWWRESIAGSYSQLEIEGTLTDPTKSGLHPHAHMLLVIPESVDSDKLADKVESFFRTEFAKHYPGETRIRWQSPKGANWWKDVQDAENLPYYLNKKGWNSVYEVTNSGAKGGGFWNREIEDLVAVWGLMDGVRSLQPTGMIRTALATARKLQDKPGTEIVTKLSNAEWSALNPEVRDALSAALENPAADSAWIAWTVANLHTMTVCTQEVFLSLLADPSCPAEVIPALIDAAPGLTPDDFFGLVVETGRLARIA